jgi:hypothetical protein
MVYVPSLSVAQTMSRACQWLRLRTEPVSGSDYVEQKIMINKNRDWNSERRKAGRNERKKDNKRGMGWHDLKLAYSLNIQKCDLRNERI